MEINPINVVELLSNEFSGSNNKTPINSTERKLAKSLAATINIWKDIDENDKMDEIASLNDNNWEEDLLSIEDNLSEVSEISEISTISKSSAVSEISTISKGSSISQVSTIAKFSTTSEISTFQDETNENEVNEQVEVFNSFEKMGLKSRLLCGIYAYGFEKPSAIQQRVIVQIIKGRDVIALAPSGVGKTAAFCIGLLQAIYMGERETQALVLSHTRGSAVNIQKVILALGDYLNVQCHACVGGTNICDDIRKLDYGQHVVTGTPGRVFDMIRRRSLRTRSIKILVLDEADELLTKEFEEQIYDIYRYLPPSAQVVLVSSKLPSDVDKITDLIMTDPIRVIVKSEINKNCTHFYINEIKKEWKPDLVFDLLDLMECVKAIICCNSRETLNLLKEKMGNEIKFNCLHSGLKQKERSEVVKEFNNGDSRILITTDINFHGLNMPNFGMIVNYDMPNQLEIYNQRVNHAHQNLKSVVVNFVEDKDLPFIRNIEKHYNIKMKKMPLNENEKI
ncbi:hypothetical protein ACQ4LE_009661 [Meloidogyne hapla]